MGFNREDQTLESHDYINKSGSQTHMQKTQLQTYTLTNMLVWGDAHTYTHTQTH